MDVPGLRVCVVLLAMLSFALPAAGADGAGGTREPDPVASLEPQKTAELWSRLASTPSRQAQTPPAQCRPLRAVFYAAADWLRLATKLAANASPCADYYVSVPPVVADKTQPRRDQAWRIRALGPQLPRAGGDPLRDLEPLGGEHWGDLAHGGHHGA